MSAMKIFNRNKEFSNGAAMSRIIYLPQDTDTRSITQKLEEQAWRDHPGFAHRLAQRYKPFPDENNENRASIPVQKRARSSWLKWQDRALLIMWIIATVMLFVRIGTAEAQEETWGLEYRSAGQIKRSVALDTNMEAEINGMVARIDVSQRFKNTGQAWAEAVYRFPLPEGAAVDRLLVKVGERTVEGEIREKNQARRQYQQARSFGVVAALVEQQRANQFETRLANIGPDEEIIVSISFLAHVDYRDEAFSLKIPLTFTPRSGPTNSPGSSTGSPDVVPVPLLEALTELDDHRLTLNIRLISGMNIASLQSRYHDMDIHPALNGYQLFLADPDTRSDRVFELNWAPDFGTAPESTLMTWDGGDAVYAMLMLAPPLVEAVAPQAREVVFVIDTSGSMEGLSLQQAKAALYQGLDRLEEGDRFNLIHFNSDSHLLFDYSVSPDEVNLVAAMDFIDELVANGGTNMAPALQDALTLPLQPDLLRQVVFVTDGSVGNEKDLLIQVADQLGDSRLFTVSIGSAPNTWFMRKAAEIGRGSHTHIGRLDEVEERMSSLWQRIENPAVQEIDVDWGMNAEYFPEIIPDLYAGEPLWLFARLPFEPQEVRLSGHLNGFHWEQVRQPLPGGGSDILATLWARSKIEAMQDSQLFGSDAELMRLEVTALALEFGLLTPYTSLVAIDHTPARPPGTELRENGIGNLLPAGSTQTTVGFSSTAIGWQTQLLFSLTTLLAATCLLWFCTPGRPTVASGSSPSQRHAG